jgi:DNA replication and repair protein RecF
MICKHLSLTNFRNYVRLGLDLPSGVCLFHGDNASGKSTLLEAIYFLATARSHRTSVDKELISRGTSQPGGAQIFARVEAEVEKSRGNVQVDVALLCEVNTGAGVYSRKRIRVNGVPRRALDLVGQVNVVMFSPADMELIVGPPALKRRYLDIMISQVDHRYLRSLQQYQRVLLQRNHLLRQIRENHRSPSADDVRQELSFWNQELSKVGSYLVAKRYVTVQLLSRLSEELYGQLSGSGGRLKLGYVSSLAFDEDASAFASALDTEQLLASLEGSFAHEVESLRSAEARAGVTLVGPHRDDLNFQVDNMDMAAYGSRGQQRTVTLALKLAEVGLMQHETGENPILLLDDILSELDRPRRQYVMKAVTEHQQQVMITAVDLSQFDSDFLINASVFETASGQVLPKGRENAA